MQVASSLIYTMLYDICKEDFEDHVRQVNSWKDLAIRCGCELDCYGRIKNLKVLPQIKQKAINMRLNIDHFKRQKKSTDDDVFIKIVKESKCLHHVAKKCVSAGDTYRSANYYKVRIEELCIDTSHWKKKSNRTGDKRYKKMNMIDDETFKTIVNNCTNWLDLYRKCSCAKKSAISERIKMLGLDTNHFWNPKNRIDDDKIFVVESQHTDATNIKRRLVCDFHRPYECNACKNVNFTTRDGVLMWNDKEITLQLEHINGVHTDNRFENLEFLCPNCHAQTSTFTGRNKKKYKAMLAWIGKTEYPPGSIASLLN